MRADIAQRAADSGFRGVGPPGSLLRAQFLLRRHQPVLQIFNEHFAHGAHLSGPEQMTRVTDHGMAGVIVRERED